MRRRVLVIAAVVLVGVGAGTAWAAYVGRTSNGTNSFSTAAGADTTAPTISRATVQKASGGSAGTFRAGGDYHVYAQITDAGSGVSTATANTSNFDSGVTSTSLSSSGGPWTVGGQSYNYRSATLAANTGLTTGTSYTYSITATDVSSNTAGPTSFSATAETYQATIAATSGLVSHWRLGDNAISADEFTDTAGKVLSSHTGDLNATWTSFGGEARTALLTNENRIRKEPGTGAAQYYVSATPSSANYLVEADVHVKSILATDAVALIGRVDTSTAGMTNYLARYDVPSGQWQLRKHVDGTATALGAYTQALTAGQTYRLTMEMSGSTIRLLVDGVERISVTDTTHTAAGRAGVRLGSGGSTAAPSDTTGMHLDNFRISSLATTATDGAGTNNGTYLNGTRLNEPGALAGDRNRAAFFDASDDYVSVPDAASLDLGNGPFTLEAWIKRGSLVNGSIFEKGTGGYELWLTGDRVALAKNGTASIASSTTTITDTTTWHHVVATKSGATTKIYIDGNDVTGTVTDQTIVDNTSPLLLDGSPQYHGHLDEMAIYNTALSAATVLDHYRAGRGTG